MANDYRDRDRYRGRDRDWREDRGPNRGMFGYEGEGFMPDRGEDIRSGFSGSYGGGAPSGYRDLESGADRGWNIGRAIDRDRGARPSHRGRGPKNYQRSDERIREEVCERLTMDHDIDATDIDVSVSEGIVTLSGNVNERHAKRLAEDLCEAIPGVKDVQNQLRVTR
jgi:BON domain